VTRLLPLFRPGLVLGNAAAALGGYLLYQREFEASLLVALFFGVALLAAAGSALNQVMERDLDLLMQRTRLRPLPSGRLTPSAVILIGLCCAAAGLWLLLACCGAFPALVGAAALAWYLLVYTPLKRRTPFALLAGGLCGMAPPVIGWSVAGGEAGDFRIVLLAGVLYLWQVPHFWLLQRRHAEDYRRAGFALFAPGNPLLPAALCRLWLGAMIAGAMLLPAFGLLGPGAPYWCAAFCAPLLLTLFKRCEPLLSPCINLFPILITCALGFAG